MELKPTTTLVWSSRIKVQSNDNHITWFISKKKQCSCIKPCKSFHEKIEEKSLTIKSREMDIYFYQSVMRYFKSPSSLKNIWKILLQSLKSLVRKLSISSLHILVSSKDISLTSALEKRTLALMIKTRK